MWRDLNEGGNRPKKRVGGGYQLAYVVECYCLLNCVFVDRFQFSEEPAVPFRVVWCLYTKCFGVIFQKGNILKNQQLEKLNF